jgi:hypothetical protein
MVNLLTGKTEAHPDMIKKDNETEIKIVSHWHPNLTVCLLDDHTPWIRGSVPQPLDECKYCFLFIVKNHVLNNVYQVVDFKVFCRIGLLNVLSFSIKILRIFLKGNHFTHVTFPF